MTNTHAHFSDYPLLCEQIKGFAATDPHYLPLLANTSALLFQMLDDINWAGFYLCREDTLVLGPFQGKPACIHIGYGRGVCGTAWQRDRIVRVEDVHAFPGHIACDSASQSEIVLPLHDGRAVRGNQADVTGSRNVIGVLDIDSPSLSRFSENDEAGLAAVVDLLESVLVF